ncbi:hypothetical protein, partial [Caballeronia arationis]|uniref:hypothetical protein n=1 Tax=Caballeronia arationis TaxID=1777142 RepID=UPI001F1C9812
PTRRRSGTVSTISDAPLVLSEISVYRLVEHENPRAGTNCTYPSRSGWTMHTWSRCFTGIARYSRRCASAPLDAVITGQSDG